MEYKTERLKSRLLRFADIDILYQEILHQKEMLYFLDWPYCETLEEAEMFVRNASLRIQKDRQYFWIIEENLTNSFVGCIAVCNQELKPKMAEIEYITVSKHRGKGYMSEAVKKICAAIIKEAGFYRVEAVCNVEKESSSRILEKAGMKYEGTLRGRALNKNSVGNPGDLRIYSQIQMDFIGKKGVKK